MVKPETPTFKRHELGHLGLAAVNVQHATHPAQSELRSIEVRVFPLIYACSKVPHFADCDRNACSPYFQDSRVRYAARYFTRPEQYSFAEVIKIQADDIG